MRNRLISLFAVLAMALGALAQTSTFYFSATNLSSAKSMFVQSNFPGASADATVTQISGNDYKAEFPGTVTGIANNAFKGSYSLTSITIPEGVTSIGESAFQGSEALTSVNIPEGVTSIGKWAFAYSPVLSSVNIPSTVTSIGESAFFYCKALTVIRIPEGVTSLNEQTFSGCDALTTVFLPSTLKTIAKSVFYDCPKLANIMIPEGVTSIGDHAFNSCVALTELSIPEGVTSIGELAFWSCKGLTTVHLPSTLTTIGESAFSRSENLAIVTCNAITPPTCGINVFKYTNAARLVVPEASIAAYEAEDEWKIIHDVTSTVTIFRFHTDDLASVSGRLVKENFVGATGDATIESGVPGSYLASFPGYVTGIKDETFKDCKKLTLFQQTGSYSYSVTSIGNRAFQGCTDLTSVGSLIYYSARKIGDYAFAGCGFSFIQLGMNAMSLGTNPFALCSNLTDIVVDSDNPAYECPGEDGYHNVIIEKDTKKLIAGCKESVIPDGVETIATRAFYDAGLPSVDIPSSVKTIQNEAFVASNFTSVDLPEGVKTVGYSAFKECPNLADISLPSTLTTVGDDIFGGCSSLDKIICYADTPPTIVDSDGTEVASPNLGGKGSSTTLYVPYVGIELYKAAKGWKNFTIKPLTVFYFSATEDISGKFVKDNFYGATGDAIVTHISGNEYMAEIPGSVERVSQEAFSGCRALTSISIPEGVVHIGQKAFYDCTNLTSVTLPETLAYIGTSAFNRCSGLTTITLPESLTYIDVTAFYGCTGLTSLTLPKNVKTIGHNAFADCKGLTSIKIPKSVTSIGTNPFNSIRKLTAIEVEEGNTKYESPDGCNAIIETATKILISGCKNTVIPDGVSAIASHAFEDSDLSSISIPGSVKSIGNMAFIFCSQTSVTIPEGVETIGKQAFFANYLTDITLPSTLTKVGYQFIYNCSDLKSVVCYAATPPTIDDTDKRLASPGKATTLYVPKEYVAAYEEAAGWNYMTIKPLTEVDFSTTDIAAVQDCFTKGNFTGAVANAVITPLGGKKYKASIPGDITGIEPWAFVDCPGLTSITIPEGVTTIGECAFVNAGLKSIKLPKSLTTIEGSAFYGCTGLKTVKFPTGLATIGKGAFTKCTSLTEISLPNMLTEMDDYAFSGCTSLTSVTIPGSLKEIGGYAFSGCTSLPSVTIPGSIKEIGMSAFYGCTALESLTLQEGLETIGKLAFDQCTSLTSIAFPASLREIGEKAFQTGKFTSLTFPENLETVDDLAFASCTDLTEATCLSLTPPACSDDIYLDVFYNVETSDIPLYVYRASLPDYKTAPVWKNFKLLSIEGLTEKPEFEAYKAQRIEEAGSLAKASESETCLQIIHKGQDDIAALAYDDLLSLDENKERVDEIFDKMKSDLATRRAIENYVGPLIDETNEILAKSFTVEMPETGVATYSAPTDVLVPDGVTAYYATSYTSTTVHLDEVPGRKIPARTGVVLKGEAGATFVFAPTTDAEPAEEGDNLLAATDGTSTALAGSYYLGSGVFKKLTANKVFPAGKAYLPVASSAVKLYLDFGDGETGIFEMADSEAEQPAYKVDGQLAPKGYKGIVIQNGKKVLRK